MITEKSILIFRQGSVGDTVVALPAFHLIKKAFPHVRRCVLTNLPANHKACALELILQNTGLVDEFIEYPSKNSILKKCVALRKLIKQRQFTDMIYFNQTRHLWQAWRDFLFFKLCGIKKIIGLSLFRHGFQYSYNTKTKLFQSEHYRLADQLKSLGTIDWSDQNIINLGLTSTEIQQAKAFIPDEINNKPFIVCSIGTKLEIKDWGQKNWLVFIARLSEIYPDYGMIFIGVEEEFLRSDELLKLWSGNTLNLCGKLSVRQSAVVLSFARLFIGHDSGPMHLADAVKTPCVAIFSRHAKPGCWFPLGKQHKIIYPPEKSILSISVDNVINAVQSILPPTKVS